MQYFDEWIPQGSVPQCLLEIATLKGEKLNIPLSVDGKRAQPGEQGDNVISLVQPRMAMVPKGWQLSDATQEDLWRVPDWLRKKVFVALDEQDYWRLGGHWFHQLPNYLQTILTATVREQENPCFQMGYLYCFQAGQLWREWACQDGMLSEVNWRQYAQCDVRPAVGVPIRDISIVTCIAGQAIENQLYYSSVQLSCQRLNNWMGDVALRAQEMLCFNEKDLVQDEDGDAPHCLIPAPQQACERMCLDLMTTWQTWQSVVAEIHRSPQFQSAMLAQQVFFNDNVAYHQTREINTAVQPFPQMPLTQTIQKSPTHELAVAAAQIDQAQLESVFGFKQRQKMKTKIVCLQHVLVNQLEQGAWVHCHVDDGLSASAQGYVLSYQWFSLVLSVLNNTPDALDQNIMLLRKEAQIKEYPGIKWLLKNTLLTKFFPVNQHEKYQPCYQASHSGRSWITISTLNQPTIQTREENKPLQLSTTYLKAYFGDIFQLTIDTVLQSLQTSIVNLNYLDNVRKTRPGNHAQLRSIQKIMVETYQATGLYPELTLAQHMSTTQLRTQGFVPGLMHVIHREPGAKKLSPVRQGTHVFINDATTPSAQVHPGMITGISAVDPSPEYFTQFDQVAVLKVEGETLYSHDQSLKNERVWLQNLTNIKKYSNMVLSNLAISNLLCEMGDVYRDASLNKMAKARQISVKLAFLIRAGKEILSEHINVAIKSIAMMPVNLVAFSVISLELAQTTCTFYAAVRAHQYIDSVGDFLELVGEGSLQTLLGAALLTETLEGLFMIESLREQKVLQHALRITTKVQQLSILNWIGLSCLLLAVVYRIYFHEDRSYRWARYGPFGKERYRGEFRAWQQTDKAYYALLGLMITPKINACRLKAGQVMGPGAVYEVIVLLPCFIMPSDSLEIIASFEVQQNNPGAQVSPERWDPLTEVKANTVRQFTHDKRPKQITQMIFEYHLPFQLPANSVYVYQRYRLQVKLRQWLGDKRISLPCGEWPQENDSKWITGSSD